MKAPIALLGLTLLLGAAACNSTDGTTPQCKPDFSDCIQIPDAMSDGTAQETGVDAGMEAAVDAPEEAADDAAADAPAE